MSCRVFTTFVRELMISSFELKRAYISERRLPRLSLNSLKVLLWNSGVKRGLTFVELPLGGKLMVGILFQFLDLHVPFVPLIFQLFFEQEERFVHFSHVLLLACDASLSFLVDRLVGFFIIRELLSNLSLVYLCPSSN